MNTKYTLKLLQFFIFFSLILSVYGQDQVSDDKLSDDIPSTTLTDTPKEEAPKEEAPKEEAPKEETLKAEATDKKEASVEESTGIAKLFGIIISILFGAVVILIVWNIFWPSALAFALSFFTHKNDANKEHNESENIQEDEFVKNKNVEVAPYYTGIIFNDTQDNKEKIFYLIKKDTPIPCSKTETLHTMVDNQTSIQLKIVQSPAEIYDFEMVKVISESTIEIPAGSPAATPVNITLTYAEDGTLNCSAEIEIPASKKVINVNTGVEDEELSKNSEDDKADQNSTINEKEEKSVANDGDDDLTKQLKNVVLKKIAEWLNKLNASINTINKKSEAGFKKIEKETSELVLATAKLNSVIENQQKEIERYKKGYDYSIRKDSFTPLLQLDDLIKNILNESDINEQTIEKLNSVEKYISSYLEERDIESFEFEVGKSYRDLPADEFEIEEIVDTDDQKFNEKIERIIKEGYCNIHPNGKNILRKVKISVYKYKGE